MTFCLDWEGRIFLTNTDDILTIGGPITTAYNINAPSLSTNNISTRYSQNKLAITANKTTVNDIEANKMLVNSISTKSGSV